MPPEPPDMTFSKKHGSLESDIHDRCQIEAPQPDFFIQPILRVNNDFAGDRFGISVEFLRGFSA